MNHIENNLLFTWIQTILIWLLFFYGQFKNKLHVIYLFYTYLIHWIVIVASSALFVFYLFILSLLFIHFNLLRLLWDAFYRATWLNLAAIAWLPTAFLSDFWTPVSRDRNWRDRRMIGIDDNTAVAPHVNQFVKQN